MQTKKNCAPQYGRNDFDTVTHDRCPGFFIFATTEEETSLFASIGSHIFVFSTAAEKRTYAMTLQMERVSIPAFSVLAGTGQLQHEGVGWEGSLRLH